VIRRPNADICVECYLFANRFKLGLNTRDDGDEDSDNESSSDEGNVNDVACPVDCPLAVDAEIFKSKFYSNMRQVQRHHSRCHKIFKGIRTQQPSSDESMEQNDNDSSSLNISQDVVSQGCIHDDVSLSLSNSGDDDAPEYCNPVSGIDSEIRTSNTNHDLAMDIHHIETSPQVAIMESTRDKFWKTIVQGNILEAASVLVSQAAFQSPNLFNANLPLPNIMLFIHLGKLVISSGLTDQYNLAKILSILYP
jgi:hypothetical protein